MTSQKFDVNEVLPLSPLNYSILFNLVGKALNGSEILRAVRDNMGDDKVVTATLYRAINNLHHSRLLEIVKDPPPEKLRDQRVRKLYKLTGYGQLALKEETRYRLEIANKLQQAPGFGDL